ncbi:hypothetical protein ACFYO2_40085 [Streptomyces sp. NPDC006602]|uniref:hypothetical protein n=1 Tax=Streptomyces sp. NPDC006602 TaxID=3364751 RepID=UPI00367F6CCD
MNGGVRVAELSAEALDEVPWDRLESIDPTVPPEEVRRVLRRLFRKGPESTEDDCRPLFNALGTSERGISSVATAALPFVVALAANPRTGARASLVELLASLSQAQETTPPESIVPGWPEAWRHAHHAVQSLLTDPDPAVAGRPSRWRTAPAGSWSGVGPSGTSPSAILQDEQIRALLDEALAVRS